MKKVLLLGAGLVARPFVRYLLDTAKVRLTIASRTVAKADAMAAGHPNATTMTWLAEDTEKLEKLVREHDLSVSLLPAPMHPIVAKLCVKHGKHMVTTSYVSPAMHDLDAQAKESGIVLLNEIGIDPGFDHMSAMRIIHDVQKRGGTIKHFRSFCGGLPAPDANDNPWGYKCSWSPRGVFTAGAQTAKYLYNGETVQIPGGALFKDNRHGTTVPGIGEFEGYPNRDSTLYVDIYNLPGVQTMIRGTYRYAGWCETLTAVADLGLVDQTPTDFPADTTFAQFTARFAPGTDAASIRQRVADRLNIAFDSAILDRFEWLGLFSDDLIPFAGEQSTALDVLAKRTEQKMKYAPGERDMIVLIHDFEAEFPNQPAQRIKSSLITYGQPDGDSAMARTVGLPSAIGVRLILDGTIREPGVRIPITADIYEPVLNELESLGIQTTEETTAA